MSDLRTMLWKEWRETARSGNRRSRVSSVMITLLIVSVVMPLQQQEIWLEGGAIAVWAAAPLILLPQMVADSFAGERERHTLETLLASRIANRAILLGKILAPVLWAWSLIQVALLLAVIPVNLAAGRADFYPPLILLTGCLLSALTSLFVAGAGVLISLRAASVRQAQQFTGLISMSFIFIPLAAILLLTILPETLRQQVLLPLETGNFMPLVTGVIFLLALVDAGLLWLADRRFQRSRLILD